MEALGLPMRSSDIYTRENGLGFVVLPEDVRDVLRVSYMDTLGRLTHLDRWSFVQDLPIDVVTTGKMLQVPAYVSDNDELVVVTRHPYRWSNHPAAPTGTSTIDLPEGAEDLPSMYAAGFLLSRREVSRADIDSTQEWNQVDRNGTRSAMVRAIWAEFYRSLDEARRLDPPPVHRPFIKMRSFR